MIRDLRPVRWVAGTAAACALALLAAWLLLVAPVLDRAADGRAQAAQVRLQNEALRGQLEVLQARDEDADVYRGELADLRRELPPEPRLADLTRQLDAAAAAAGVTVLALAVDATVDPAGRPPGDAPADVPADAPADLAVDPATTAPAATAPATTDPATGVPGMVAIPLRVAVAGPEESVRTFLGLLQSGLDRRLLVATLTVTAAPGSAGEPAGPSAPGGVRATVGVYAYVLPAPATGTTTGTGGTTTGPTAGTAAVPAG